MSESWNTRKKGLAILMKLHEINKVYLERASYFETKFDLSRMDFLKIYNLFSVLAFITILRKTGETSDCPEIADVGIDLETLQQDSFPQLKMENTILIQKLFMNINNCLDVKTSKLILTL